MGSSGWLDVYDDVHRDNIKVNGHPPFCTSFALDINKLHLSFLLQHISAIA